MLGTFRWVALASAVVFVIAFAGVIVSGPSTPSHQQEQGTEHKTEHANKESGKTLWDTWFPDSLSLYTLALVVFTAVLAFGGLYQLRALERAERIASETAHAAKVAADAALKQTEAMQRQLVLMETDQRPWLKAQFEILKPLIFDSNGLQLTSSGKTLNVGKFPALNAQLYPLIVISGEDVTKTQKEFCENIRNSRQDKSGAVIFPGDNIINSPITRGFSWEEINRGKTMLRFDSPDFKRDLLGIVLTGCVVYSLPGHKDSMPRITGFGYLLRQSKGLGLDTDQETIPVNEITSFILPELTWAD
jgi:hypothetical protein